MAYRSAPLLEDVIWRTHLQPQDPTLAETVRATIAEHREHLLEFIRLDEPAPLSALTLAQWSSPTALRSLLAVYSDHIYRNQPLMLRENKPLISLWAQWYIGLMMPPLMLALLTQEKALDLSPEHFHVEFHETGRAACFWIDVCENKNAPHLPQQRMEKLISQAIAPVVQALEATGEINGKLIWSNTGYLINWYLTEMKQLLGDATVESLRHALFLRKHSPRVKIILFGVRWCCATACWCAVPAANVIACRMYSNAATVR